MKTRCNNPNVRDYANYGGRGIRVCESWDSFASFLKDMGETYRDGLTLDRIDCNGDYSRENCRWITIQEQQKNRRNTGLIEHLGEKKTLREWSHVLGIPHSTLMGRYYNYGKRTLAECI